ncbi:hypothetical protein APH_0619 [Anaplasma phagocytophilum str. HZ]|uniref:Uncharacterized protein n=1 Tax=Anaplasma phagocytophilum (strain HZ) TaxID=212042 RepID=Q2GK94_ANAPZ|nr:hypothetical protein APH_0619 [Anaplasma phagocytophilum str. HZ]
MLIAMGYGTIQARKKGVLMRYLHACKVQHLP